MAGALEANIPFALDANFEVVEEAPEADQITLSRDLVERAIQSVRGKKIREELQEALDHVRTLSGLLPICANCHKVRDDGGYWNRVETYMSEHLDVEFSHGICPECIRELYPEIADRLEGQLE